jgi:hypothetical protein
MNRRSLVRRTLLWLVGSAVGAVVVALPDPDNRVFSLSRTHGPSPLDLVGVVILIGCWLPAAAMLPRLWRAVPRAAARLAAILALVGALGLTLTIGADLGGTWLIAVAALVTAQIVLIAAGWRVAEGHRYERVSRWPMAPS